MHHKIALFFALLLGGNTLIFAQQHAIKAYPAGVTLDDDFPLLNTYWGYEGKLNLRSSLEAGAGYSFGPFYVFDASESRILNLNLKYRYHFLRKDSLLTRAFYVGGLAQARHLYEGAGAWNTGWTNTYSLGLGIILGKKIRIGKHLFLDPHIGLLGAYDHRHEYIGELDPDDFTLVGEMKYKFDTFGQLRPYMGLHLGWSWGKK